MCNVCKCLTSAQVLDIVLLVSKWADMKSTLLLNALIRLIKCA